MRGEVIVAALLALSTPALAQQTKTTCGEEFGKWVCRSETKQPYTPVQPYYQRDPDAFERGYERARRLREDYERQQAVELPQPPATSEASQTRKNGVLGQALREGAIIVRQQEVAALLREGRCEDAKQRALKDDDIDLADKAARICGVR